MRKLKSVIALFVTITLFSMTPSFASAQHVADSSVKVNVISQKKFKRQMNRDNVVILDVRTPEEFNAGHIPGAIMINYKDSTFGQQVNSLDKNKRYLLYCKSGNRSNKATQYMLLNGFQNVQQLKDGYSKWKDKP